MSVRSWEMCSNARPVNDGGPTAMNIPGRVLGDGRPFVKSRAM